MENKENEDKPNLNLVMYALFHLRDLKDAQANRYMYNIYQQFTEEFDKKLQVETIESIEWALEPENIDQCCTLPNLPGSKEFKREYLKIVLGHLKKAMA